MANILNLPRLLEYILRVTGSSTAGQKKASQVYLEYYDDNYMTHRKVKAKSMRVEQSEHGPLTLIISTLEIT